MDQERDRQRLGEYEAELGEAEARYAEVGREVEALRDIVNGLRKRLGGTPAKPQTDSATAQVNGRRAPELDAAEALRQRVLRRLRGGGLKHMLLAELEERGRLDIETTLEIVRHQSDAAGTPMPSRNTIVSRLGDLVREGVAHSPERGVYAFGPGQPLGQTSAMVG